MLKIAIFLLTFGSAALFFTAALPLIIARYERTQLKKYKQTVDKLDTMFVEVKRQRLSYIIFTTFPLALGIAGFVLYNNMFAGLGGVVLGLLLPSLVIQNLEKIRKRRFQGQLIDALLTLANCLKSGLTILQAFEVVVEEMPAPIGQEFRLLLNENKMGIPFEDSLNKLNKRMYSDELNMMVTSILVARETGGDLSTIFERLVFAIRQKNKIARQVETLTLQARWQGLIMMALPFLFAFTVFRMNPDFFDIMLGTSLGRGLLIYAVFSQIFGIFLVKRMSKVEV